MMILTALFEMIIRKWFRLKKGDEELETDHRRERWQNWKISSLLGPLPHDWSGCSTAGPAWRILHTDAP